MCVAFALTQCNVRAAPAAPAPALTPTPPTPSPGVSPVAAHSTLAPNTVPATANGVAAAVAAASEDVEAKMNLTKLHMALWSTPQSTRLRKRHSKRNSNWYENYNEDYDENSMAWELVNPCNGNYQPLMKRTHKRDSTQAYIRLKRAVNAELSIMKGSPQYINVSDIERWSYFHNQYKFLPKMKLNSTIPLKRWYRNMQTYVSTFGYLHRAQMRFERSKSQPESNISSELKSLLMSSRTVLCELEQAINSTRPYHKHLISHQPQPRSVVNKRLKLRTRRQADLQPGVPKDADSIDLRFSKYYYYEFMETMWKVLRRYRKRKGNTGLTVHHNNKQFNEVAKNFGSISAAPKRTPADGNGRRKAGDQPGRKKRPNKAPKKHVRNG